jgi:hypothetical protein
MSAFHPKAAAKIADQRKRGEALRPHRSLRVRIVNEPVAWSAACTKFSARTISTPILH